MKYLFAFLKRFCAIDLAFFSPGIDSAETPGPDPLIGRSSLLATTTGQDALQFMKDAYYQDIRPRQQALDEVQRQASEVQLSDMRGASALAGELRQEYRDTYLPVERQSAKDAMEYDSEGNIQKRMGIASANVNQAFDTAGSRAVAEMAKYGIRPNPAAFAALQSRIATQRATADAGSRTGAAFDTIDRGIALRTGVVNSGRGAVNNAANVMAGGTSAGGAAVGGGATAAGTGVQGLGAVGAGFNTSINGLTAGGNLGLADYNSRMQTERFNTDQRNQGYGAVLGAAAMMMSSEKLKDRKEDASGDNLIEKVKGLRVDRWGYKGDGMLHIGPYAEEMHSKFGVGDGTKMGAADAGGVALATVKQVVNKLEKMGLNLSEV